MLNNRRTQLKNEEDEDDEWDNYLITYYNCLLNYSNYL